MHMATKIKQKQKRSGTHQWLLDIALAIIWKKSNIPKRKRKRELTSHSKLQSTLWACKAC